MSIALVEFAIGAALLFIGFWGLLYLGLGALQWNVYCKRPTEKQIDDFLDSLQPAISFLYLGLNDNIIFSILLSIRRKTLYQVLHLISQHDPDITYLRLLFPFVFGGFLVTAQLIIMGAAAIQGNGFAQLVGIYGSVILLMSSVLSLSFGNDL